jgi:hypothetical protein
MNQINKAKLAAQKAIDTVTSMNQRGVLNEALFAAGIPSSPPDQFWKTNRVAILFWREYVKAGGLDLDPELWCLEAGAEEYIADAVEAALVSGLDPSKATAAFLYTSGVSADIMRAGINHQIDDVTDFGGHITMLFTYWIHLANRAVQDITTPHCLGS